MKHLGRLSCQSFFIRVAVCCQSLRINVQLNNHKEEKKRKRRKKKKKNMSSPIDSVQKRWSQKKNAPTPCRYRQNKQRKQKSSEKNGCQTDSYGKQNRSEPDSQTPHAGIQRLWYSRYHLQLHHLSGEGHRRI